MSTASNSELREWRWGYQIKGRRIYLYGLNGYNRWVKPQLDIDNGLKITYTTGSKVFVDSDGFSDNTAPTEDSILNCSKAIALAIVDFLKAKVAEGAGNQGLYIEYMRRYRDKFNKSRDAITGPRRIIPSNPFAFRSYTI